MFPLICCRYKVDDIAPTKKTHVDPRLEALYTKITELVGIGEAKEEVITRLANGDQQETTVVYCWIWRTRQDHTCQSSA